MLLLSVMVLAITVIMLGSFLGKMVFFVGCIFCVYVLGIATVSGIWRLVTRAAHLPRKPGSGHLMLA
jgi:hypothetical protein